MKPLGCMTESRMSWAPLIKKAYAKVHGSWEAISGGGYVEEALTDLTGGCAGRFHTGDCAGDRMWKYFQELQATTLFAVSLNLRECSKRLISLDRPYAAAVYDVVAIENVPYIGVFTTVPPNAARRFPTCRIPLDALEGRPSKNFDETNGFLWLRVDDFVQLFDAIYECRLVNSDITINEPIPRPLP